MKEKIQVLVYKEILETLMKEDRLDLETAQDIVSEYYQISLKELRKSLLMFTETKNYAYDYLFWDSEGRKFVNRLTVNYILKKLKNNKILNKLKSA